MELPEKGAVNPLHLFFGHVYYRTGEKWHFRQKCGSQRGRWPYIYIYVYIYICCEVIIWAKFGHFRCYYLGQVGVIIWAKLFLAYKNSGFKRFLAHTVIILCFFLCPIIWQLSKNSLFQKRVQKLGFSIFCVLSLKFENSLF